MKDDITNYWFQVELSRESERHYFTCRETEAWEVAEQWSAEDSSPVCIHLYCDAERRQSWQVLSRLQADGSTTSITLDEAM